MRTAPVRLGALVAIIVGLSVTTSACSPTPAPTPDAPCAAEQPRREARPLGVAPSVCRVLGPGVVSFDDFTHPRVGMLVHAGLSGAGETRTIIEMAPGSSTKAGLVPVAPDSTNPLWLLKAQGGSPVLRGFTLQGTPQGHLYNGLLIKECSDARISDIRVNAIPGNDHVNPGETFGINDFRSADSVYTGVEVDGAGVGASGLAFNGSTRPTVSNSWSHDNPYSAGLALWQTHDATITDVRTTDNRTGINLERVSGLVRISRTTFQNDAAQDIYVGSDLGSATIIITDPVLTGRLRVRIPVAYRGVPNRQLRSDLHVLIGGVDRTSESVEWL